MRIASSNFAWTGDGSLVPGRALDGPGAQRHTVMVRATHWINTAAFFALVVSGAAILLAHPRFYWGETGAYGSPALIELPLPVNLDQSGWGRSLHFLAAWICVLNGAIYVLCGMRSGHFKKNLTPSRTDLTGRVILQRLSDALHWRKPQTGESLSYNGLQRLVYLVAVFALFPLMIMTGLSMSPAVSSLLPLLVQMFGGYQSARTIHFLVTNVLIVFVVVHVAMICLAGFKVRMRAMIVGNIGSVKDEI